MIKSIAYGQTGFKSFRVRECMNKNKSNGTLVVGSSLLKGFKNDKYECVSIAGARVQDIAKYIKSMNDKNDRYLKKSLLLGGNNLHDWKKRNRRVHNDDNTFEK